MSTRIRNRQPSDVRVLFYGQSLNLTGVGTHDSYPHLMMATRPYLWSAAPSVTGWGFVQLKKKIANLIAPYTTQSTTTVMIMLGAETDYAPGTDRTGAECLADQQQIATDARAAGVDKIIASTTPDCGFSGANETARLDGNALLLAAVNPGVTFDAVVDLAADPYLADSTNSTYYETDQTHPKLPGRVRIAELMGRALDTVLGVASRFPVNPGIVWGPLDVAGWETTSAAYTALVAATSLSTSYASPGTQILYSHASLPDRIDAKNDSEYAMRLAVVYAADPTTNAAYGTRCRLVLDSYKDVGSVPGLPGWESPVSPGDLSERLYASWAAINFCRAAQLVGYWDTHFVTGFMVGATYPIMDHVKNFNWHATFAMARLAIAILAGDTTLWAAAKTWLATRMSQGIYHATYDSGNVVACTGTDGVTPSLAHTIAHWGGEYDSSAKQVDGGSLPLSVTSVFPGGLPNGCTAERTHDFGHVQLGLGAYMQALRTILIQDGTVSTTLWTRLLAAYGVESTRVLHFLQSATWDTPRPFNDEGGPEHKQAWLGALKLFGPACTADMTAIAARSEVTGYAAAGANHLCCEIYADA